MIKLAFFDVDGTLSAPTYLVNGNFQLGMSAEDWIKYKTEHGEDTYAYCKPVKAVREYALKLKAAGTTLYVLSASEDEIEDKTKVKFLETHYKDIFDETFFVRHEDEKVNRMKRIAEEKGIRLEEIEIVEDTYKILLDAVVEGIKATHIANIFCGL